MLKTDNPVYSRKRNSRKKNTRFFNTFKTEMSEEASGQGLLLLLSGCERGSSNLEEKSGSTLGGVEGFLVSLYKGAFCSGFLCHITTVSWLGGVYSGWEKGHLSAQQGLLSSTSGLKV